jgi:AmiR/NasT family two-component response regulator
MPEPTEREQIEGLQAEAQRREGEIRKLSADALVSDERIAALVREVDGLHRAMEHRAVIEQAKGVVMSATGCGPDAAFAVLVAQSQTQNRKLWEVANELARAQDRDGTEA